MGYARLTRGDIVKVILPGDFGKGRPAVIVQTNEMLGLPSVLVCPFTSAIVGSDTIRVVVEPTESNGLEVRSELMVEKVTAVLWSRVRVGIGRLDEATMQAVDARLRLVLGLV